MPLSSDVEAIARRFIQARPRPDNPSRGLGLTIYEIEDGTVQREEGIVDRLARIQQLGLSAGRPDAE